jgi:hypothetical protein
MYAVTPSAPIIPRCECGSVVELGSNERLEDGSELRIYHCSACKRIILRKSETAEISRASEDGPAGPATSERKLRVRPKRNKLSYKNRWLISRHLVIALRRAGVVCDIVVPDRCGNAASLPPADLSQRERVDLARRCAGLEADLGPIEADPQFDAGPSPSKSRH